MIVIDGGCATWGREESVHQLVDRYFPSVRTVHGFDPGLHREVVYHYRGADCRLVKKALWTYDGWLGFEMDGARSYVTELTASSQTECVDLARVIDELASPEELVLKLDIEGGEYHLLEYLHESGRDAVLSRVLVEWHTEDDLRPDLEGRRAEITAALRCPIEQWQ